MDTFNRFTLFLILVILTGCTKQASYLIGEIPNSSNNAFNYIFSVTRISNHPQVQYPSDMISESQYRTDSSGKFYNVRFSPDGKQVFIKQGPIDGIYDREDGQTKSYNLVNGVFAGGRFVVWFKAQPLEAELTIYGSGDPIIYSERGNFIQTNN